MSQHSKQDGTGSNALRRPLSEAPRSIRASYKASEALMAARKRIDIPNMTRADQMIFKKAQCASDDLVAKLRTKFYVV